MIFAPAADPNAVSYSCESKLTDTRVKCADNVSSKSGEEYTWTVTKPGQYELEVFAPAKKVAFDPQLIVKNAAGEVVADVEGGIGGNAKATLEASAGTYTVIVKPGDDYMVKGGFSFDLEIRGAAAAQDGTKVADPLAADPDTLNADVAANEPTPEAVPAPKAPAKKAPAKPAKHK
jgi:plastocyanin